MSHLEVSSGNSIKWEESGVFDALKHQSDSTLGAELVPGLRLRRFQATKWGVSFRLERRRPREA